MSGSKSLRTAASEMTTLHVVAAVPDLGSACGLVGAAVHRTGQSRKRVGRNGDVRYTAYYEDARGHRH